GFGAAPKDKVSEDLFRESRTKDFIDFGFEAEFIGRLPVRVFCDSLSADDLFQIMKMSEGSLIRQYEREFHAYGVRAVFEDDALRTVAERAAEEKTGARGLVTAWEKVLRDFKFELPSLGLPDLIVNGALVSDPEKALEQCRQDALHFQSDGRADEVRAFAAQFSHEHNMELVFDPDAIHALVMRAEREGSGVQGLCARLFKDYPFGLQLVARTTGQKVFHLNRAAVEQPDQYLSDLVVTSYRRPGAPEPQPFASDNHGS
ncbi:MAG: ATP-dependent protease, partial [Prosthecobacter sp.]|nr:ATP-dependent protease [Prosthecobacter sp.]